MQSSNKLIVCHFRRDQTGLLLTPYLEKGQVEAAKYRSRVMMMKRRVHSEAYSGYITVDKKHQSNLFFLHILAKLAPKKAPLLLWLHGGPGKSALFSQFLENGPLGISGKGMLYRRRHTVQNFANVIYLDQPPGAGFSYTKSPQGYAQSLQDSTAAILEFLRQFLVMFPEYQNRNFFVAGESYGARAAIGIAHHLQTQKDSGVSLKLGGVICGVGFLGPTLDIVDSSEFLYQIGMVDERGRATFAATIQQIRDLAEVNRTAAVLMLGNTILHTRQSGQRSLFVRLTGYNDHGSALTYACPPQFDHYYRYAQRPIFKRGIHVSPTARVDGDRLTVALNLGMKDYFTDISPLVQDVLDSQRVLVYSAQMDTVLPAVNLDKYFRSLNWTGAEQFRAASRQRWYSSGENPPLLGYVTTVKDLTHVLLTRAGHHASFDQTATVYKMIKFFVSDRDFLTSYEE
ncbi:unnamed protein product [Ixodes pacificus]